MYCTTNFIVFHNTIHIYSTEGKKSNGHRKDYVYKGKCISFLIHVYTPFLLWYLRKIQHLRTPVWEVDPV